MEKKINKVAENQVGIKSDVTHIKETLHRIEKFMERAEKKFVTMNRFNPVEKIVYGMVGVILITVVGSILSKVVLAFT